MGWLLLWWIVVALVVVLLVVWLSRADWTCLRDAVEGLTDRTRRGLSLLLAAAVLLVLRGIALLVVCRDVALTSIAVGWVLAVVVLMVAYHLPRG